MTRSLAVAAREDAPPAYRGAPGSRSRDLLPGDTEVAVLAIHLYAAAPRSFLLDTADDDVHTGARRRGLDIALGGEGVDNILRPRLNLSGLRVAAVIEINTDERIGATEDEPDAVVRRLSGLVSGEGILEARPRQQVGAGGPAIRAGYVGNLRCLAFPRLVPPAHPLRAFGELLGDVLGDQGDLPCCFLDHGCILLVGVVRGPRDWGPLRCLERDG